MFDPSKKPIKLIQFPTVVLPQNSYQIILHFTHPTQYPIHHLYRQKKTIMKHAITHKKQPVAKKSAKKTNAKRTMTTKKRVAAPVAQRAATPAFARRTPATPAFITTTTMRRFNTEAVAATIEPDVTTVIPPRRPTVLNHSLVMMCSGPDDKDVLPLISQTVTKLQGSVEESRMTCLGADFTVCTLLTIPMTVKPEHLQHEILQALPDFTVACRVTSPAPPAANYEAAKILALDVEGPDQPRIVSTFTQILYKHNVAVKDVITDTSSAPFLGYNVFAMKAVVSIPLKTDMKRLEQELQAFESQFGVNLAVSDPADQQQAMEAQHQQGQVQKM